MQSGSLGEGGETSPVCVGGMSQCRLRGGDLRKERSLTDKTSTTRVPALRTSGNRTGTGSL